MTSNSNESESPLEDISLVGTWNPVEVIEDPTRISKVKGALCDFRDKEVTLDRINSQLDEGIELNAHEFSSIMAGLEESGAANSIDTSGATYAESKFSLKYPDVLHILNQWMIAAEYRNARKESQENKTTTELVATLPPDSPSWLENNVDRTNLELRHLVVRAKKSVRIAAPYLDAEEDFIDDLASLPRQGVNLQILTRQAMEPESDQRSSIKDILQNVDSSSRDNIVVRDLYERSEGGQKKALHAKAVIVDEKKAYIGSANFNSTSLGSNFELGVLLYGTLVNDVVHIFDTMFEISNEVNI